MPAEPEARLRHFVIESARLINDLHAQHILLLDVRQFSELTDYILIASGSSARQLRSLGDRISDLAEQYQLRSIGHETDPKAMWIVLDYVDVVVHLFEPNTRAHYDLEMLWGDAPIVPWQR